MQHLDKNNYEYFTIEEASTPKSGHIVVIDGYWMLTEDNKIAIYKGIGPQYNPTLKMVESLCERMGYKSVIQVPIVYAFHNCNWYNY